MLNYIVHVETLQSTCMYIKILNTRSIGHCMLNKI
jgi:hypothetical protein